MTRLIALAGLLVSLPLVVSTPPAAATGGDRLVFYDSGQLLETQLPGGPVQALDPVDAFPVALAYGPDGELYGVTVIVLSPPGGPFLSRYVGDGQFEDLVDLSSFEGELAISGSDAVLDMAFDETGRLFVLVRGFTDVTPSIFFTRLLVLEAESFQPVGVHLLTTTPSEIPQPNGVAPAPSGLWVLGSENLYRFYPETGDLVDSGLELGPLGAISAADTDSAGGIWYAWEPGFVDPPLFSLSRLDPTTGGLTTRPLGQIGGPTGLAIEQACQASDTRRCVQGGRFAVEATWSDGDGNSDAARIAPAGSADTALLWFFEASNWELMVKVLDGCHINEHFWVYAAASTDVAYTLTVTDLESGEVFTFENPLGAASPAVNDTQAFATCP